MLKQVEIFTDGSCLGNPGHLGVTALFYAIADARKPLAQATPAPPTTVWS